MNDSTLLRAIAAGRVALGATALVAPRRLGRAMFGPAATSSTGRLIVRMLGARDLALGAAQLATIDDDRSARSIATLAAAADAIDAAATLVALRRLPRRARIVALASATGAAVAGYRAAERLRL